jgi:hypothetical protein
VGLSSLYRVSCRRKVEYKCNGIIKVVDMNRLNDKVSRASNGSKTDSPGNTRPTRAFLISADKLLSGGTVEVSVEGCVSNKYI